jgi:maltoporin
MASDQLKKEEVKLQISDKNISAAIELTKKGRHKLSVAKVEESEAEFLSIVDRQSKEKKKNIEFIDTLRKANLKHREAIENLMKDMPQGQVELMQKQREKNMDIGKKLAAIKS